MQEESPKISVIMPCYNHGKYIIEAIDSVLAQTYKDFEIIVVDDGSTDEYTKKILDNLDKPKTRILRIENSGPANARNTGIEEAKSEYIFNLDADDKIEKTYFEKAIKILESDSDVGLVFSDYKFFGEFNLLEKLKYSFPEYLILSNCAIATASFFKKSDWEKCGKYKLNMKKGLEDYDFFVSLVALGIKVVHIQEPLFFYRQIKKGKSRSLALTTQNIKECYYQIYQNNKAIYDANIKVLLDRIIDAEYENRAYKKFKKYAISFIVLTYILIFLGLETLYFLNR